MNLVVCETHMTIGHLVSNIISNRMKTELLGFGPVLEHVFHTINECLPHVLGIETTLIECPTTTFSTELTTGRLASRL